MYYLHMSNKDGTNALTFPVPLEELPTINKEAITETFTSYNGIQYTFQKGMSACEFTIDTWIPKQGVKYNFTKHNNANESKYITLLNMAFSENKPLKIAIISKVHGTFISSIVRLLSYSLGKNKNGETTINMKFKEHNEYAL